MLFKPYYNSNISRHLTRGLEISSVAEKDNRNFRDIHHLQQLLRQVMLLRFRTPVNLNWTLWSKGTAIVIGVLSKVTIMSCQVALIRTSVIISRSHCSFCEDYRSSYFPRSDVMGRFKSTVPLLSRELSCFQKEITRTSYLYQCVWAKVYRAWTGHLM